MREPRRRRRVIAAWSLGVVATLVISGIVVVTSLAGGHSFGGRYLPHPPSSVAFGTDQEIGTRGDDPNPGAVLHGAFPSNDQTQERVVGGRPARFSGYTTWVRSVTTVPARSVVPAYRGAYLRVRVTIFNRDDQEKTQHVCACDFFVWTRAAGYREADAVPLHSVSPDSEMRTGAHRDGDVYLYVGTVPGPYFVVYDPDRHVPGSASTTRGVWRVPT